MELSEDEAEVIACIRGIRFGSVEVIIKGNRITQVVRHESRVPPSLASGAAKEASSRN